MDRTRTYLTPPRLASLPAEAGQLEYSSRALVFPRDGGGILRAWGDPDDPWIARIEPSGARWKVTAWGADPVTARAAVRTMFSLDHPLEEFYRAVRGEPVLRGVDRRFHGLRIPRDGTLYESLVHAIIGQQLSVAVAGTLERRLIEAAGSVRSAGGVAVPYLPGPRTLLALDPRRFASIGLSRAKQRAIRGVAEQALIGAFAPVGPFQDAPREEAIDRLDALPGVGRWTAENALLRGAGRRDLFMAGDLGLRAALAAYGAVPSEASEEAARQWGDRWYPGWGSYATLYLWRKWIADGTPRVTQAPRPPGARRRASRGRRPTG